jgi:hypothetical protein
VLVPDGKGGRLEVAVLGRGQFVGERSVINDRLRSADVIAAGAVQVRGGEGASTGRGRAPPGIGVRSSWRLVHTMKCLPAGPSCSSAGDQHPLEHTHARTPCL